MRYIYDFKNEVLLEFGDPTVMKEGVIAYTDTLGEDDRVHVVVNPDVWVRMENVDRLAVIYHELGHDILNLEHISEHGPLMSVYAPKKFTLESFFRLKHEMILDFIRNN